MCEKIVTELAVLDVTPEGFKLLERAPGITIEEIQRKTAGTLRIESDVPEMRL
jgi:3-oxoacid CoA-transferase subunit B